MGAPGREAGAGSNRTAIAAACLTGIGLMLAGCVGTTSQPITPAGPALRSSVETAPADLQLMCAAEAAKVYSAPADKILPVSSARSGETTYDVDLNVNGKPARCTIDDSATTISVVDIPV